MIQTKTGLSSKERRLEHLLYSDNIPYKEIEALNEKDHAEFVKILYRKLDELNNEHARLSQVLARVSEMPPNRLNWESNDLKITRAMLTALHNNAQIPNQTQLAQLTGLSRKTVNEHMAANNSQSRFAEHLQQFGMMAPQILNIVLRSALKFGNLQAVKLYFNILEKYNGPGAQALLNQNNYIQINNTVIKQETIQQLSPEQLMQIEEIVQRNVPVTATVLEGEKELNNISENASPVLPIVSKTNLEV